jgi:oxygen-independent coproporphyrinogen-3 oxidase
MNNLIEKYNIPAPRYTSYPTVPYWDETPPTEKEWKNLVIESYNKTNATEGINLYIHLPFCESLCTYCGCNTRITINHNVEKKYLAAVLREWSMYLTLFKQKPKIKEIHLGGGTPTFFSASNLELLIKNILDSAEVCENPEFSFEAHPANTTLEHLNTLYKLGFKRLSLGIQDFDTKVQDIINRQQSFEQVKHISEQAKKIGYTSVNFDLIYGLPLQTIESTEKTINKVIELKPERIAFYSYAHVPWIKPGQRKFTEQDLPTPEIKRLLYENGRKAFEKAGYVEIGMDHFALPNDPLYIAEKKGLLNRNFMGYTTSSSSLLIGLGASSISDSWTGFIQNEKKIEDYYKKIESEQLPIFKGHVLSKTDMILRKHILNIMCKQKTTWYNKEEQCDEIFEATERLLEMKSDKLIVVEAYSLSVTEKGKAFLRNICMAFDARLWKKQPQTTLFSSSI